jgi:hypothetical protein
LHYLWDRNTRERRNKAKKVIETKLVDANWLIGWWVVQERLHFHRAIASESDVGTDTWSVDGKDDNGGAGLMVEGDAYKLGVEQASVEVTRLEEKERQTQIELELATELMHHQAQE